MCVHRKSCLYRLWLITRRRPIDSAWDIALSDRDATDKSSSIAQTFADDEYLESRQFKALHKITLGLSLSANTLKSMLGLSSAQLNHVDANGRTCLSWASARKDQASLNTLLEYGADPRIPDLEGRSPLFHAVKAGAVECVESLFHRGLDFSARSAFGGTALHTAAAADDNPEILRLLIHDGNIDINTIDFDGDTALNAAAREDRVENAKVLLRDGADPNLANVASETAIFHAIYWYAHRTARLLLDRGVDCDLRNSRGETVLHALASHFDPEMLSVMRGAVFKDVDSVTMDKDGKTCRDHLQLGVDAATQNGADFDEFLVAMDLDSGTEDDAFEDALEVLS